MELKHLTYGIVGLGIMGGSFAKAIRQNIMSQARIFPVAPAWLIIFCRMAFANEPPIIPKPTIP